MDPTEPIWYLDEAATRLACARMDPLDVLGRSGRRLTATVHPVDEQVVLLADPGTRRVVCVVCSAYLPMLCSATMVVVAARSLIGARVVTVGLVADDAHLATQLGLLVAGLPDAVHLVVWQPHQVPARRSTARIAGELGRRGVGLSVTASVREAVYGADLVVVQARQPPWLDPGWLAPQAIVLHAVGVTVTATAGRGGHRIGRAAGTADALALLTEEVYRLAVRHGLGVGLTR